MIDVDPDLALSCPICMEKYSETRYPIAPYCGHSICKECGDKRKSNQCVSCTEHCFYDVTNKTLPWPSNDWRKNFALLEIVSLHTANLRCLEDRDLELKTLKRKYESIVSNIPNGIDHKRCSRCETMEKRERLKICGTCAEKRDVEWKGMEEGEILHALLCAYCCLKEHFGHSLVDYLPWKLEQLLSSTVTRGECAVSSMDEICAYEVEKGKEELEKWSEEMNSFTLLQLNSYRAGKSIAESLKLEADLVTRVTEDCIPSLRKYRKVVTVSSSRLQILKQEVSEGKIDTERSELVKEEVTALINAPPQIDILKRSYEETIRKLEENVKELKAEVLENMRVVNCKRLPETIRDTPWRVNPDRVDRLHFSVSHPMTLIAIEMYGARKPTVATGNFTISLPDEELLLVRQDYELWDGTAKYSTNIVINNPVKLLPQRRYLVELRVSAAAELHCGRRGEVKNVVSPDPLHLHAITFGLFDGSSNSTNIRGGQFPGFYFLVNQ